MPASVDPSVVIPAAPANDVEPPLRAKVLPRRVVDPRLRTLVDALARLVVLDLMNYPSDS